MSVAQLTDANFQAINNGRVLALNRIPPGLCFVMFKTDACGYCTRFAPIFQKIAAREQRVRFFIADVGRYRSIIGMAQTSNTPVRGVPMFVFYVNGMPKAKYNGKQEEGSVINFLNDMISKFSSQVQSSFMPQQQPMQQQQQYGPRPTPGRVNTNMAMQGQQLGIGLSQAELERQHSQMSSSAVPDGVIPHNAPWEQYKNVGLQY